MQDLAQEIDGLAFEVDITSKQANVDLVNFTLENYGQIDLAVTNVGLATRGPIAEETEEHLQLMTEVNYFGTYWFIRAVADVMEEGGAIVTTSSLIIGTSALFSQHTLAEESSKPILPITIQTYFLEGQGLFASDPATVSDEGVSTEGTINSSSHLFFEGKISAYVFDVDPGKVRIDGLPYDEYIHILEGRLILTPDDGEEVEYKKGDSLILPA